MPLRKITQPGTSYPVWVEVYPERCPGCQQPWRGGHMAVGWLACGCNDAGRHRTLYCRDCRTEVFLPPHAALHGPWLPRTEPAAWPWYPPPLKTGAG